MIRALLLVFAALAAALPASEGNSLLRSERSSPGDLEIGGELAHIPDGSTRFIRYEDLLALPQETYTVTDDSNLPPNTEISGVSLESLEHLLGKSPHDPFIVAICYDKYRTNYPADYLAQHHPLLVLRINGKLRDQWPRSTSGDALGPYLISHPVFKPAFKILSHEDEPQIPYGVTRLEFRQESQVFGAIRPRGHWPAKSQVQQGYLIARQDCFRCHNQGAEGGTMAGRSWEDLANSAWDDGPTFRQTIHNPQSINPASHMPPHPQYDFGTLDALTAYFKTFATAGRNP
jgi:mono/diheme cytochrome c family protein